MMVPQIVPLKRERWLLEVRKTESNEIVMITSKITQSVNLLIIIVILMRFGWIECNVFCSADLNYDFKKIMSMSIEFCKNLYPS